MLGGWGGPGCRQAWRVLHSGLLPWLQLSCPHIDPVGTLTNSGKHGGLPLWGGERGKGSWGGTERSAGPLQAVGPAPVLREGGQLPLRWCMFTSNLLLFIENRKPHT